MRLMQYFCFSIFLVTLLGASTGSHLYPPAKPKLRALIIAVGDYPRTGGWNKLSSARDAELLEPALRTQGFKDITVLLDEAATRQGIEDAFNALTRKTGPGDIVYLHFSGHGQQVWDHDSSLFPDRKKDETDGFDEALVPYDARDEFRAGIYEGEHHLVDDELHLMLTELRRRIGPAGQLLFSVDACYSGSISRAGGLLPVRGTSKKFSPQVTDSGIKPLTAEGAFSEVFTMTETDALSDFIVFSAARADQPNYETLDHNGQGVGSLSYALSRNMVKPFEEVPSLSTFFRYVESEMAKVAPYQAPQLEGNGDKSLFGDALTPTPGYPVLSFTDEKHFTAQGGELAGLFPGSVIWLQPSLGAAVKEKIKGKVTASEISRSTIELERALPGANPADWVMTVQSKMLAFSPVQIRLEVQDESISEKIKIRAGGMERIALVKQNAQLLIRQSSPEAPLILSDFHGAGLGTYTLIQGAMEETIDQLFGRIQAYTRAQYFRSFSKQATDHGKEVEITTVPVAITRKGSQYVVQSIQKANLRDNRDVQFLEIGTPFIFSVTNRSASKLYLNIIGIDAADEVFLLLPDARTPPAEFVIAADTTVYFSRPEHLFQISEPSGKQLFMAMASPQPVDLRPVFRYASSGKTGDFRSETNPQHQVLNELFYGKTRAGGLASGEILISSTIIDIPKQE